MHSKGSPQLQLSFTLNEIVLLLWVETYQVIYVVLQEVVGLTDVIVNAKRQRIEFDCFWKNFLPIIHKVFFLNELLLNEFVKRDRKVNIHIIALILEPFSKR